MFCPFDKSEIKDEPSGNGKVKPDFCAHLRPRVSIAWISAIFLPFLFLIGSSNMTYSQSPVSLSPHEAAAEKQGFDPKIGRKLQAGVEAGLLRHLHIVLVERGGETVLESYGAGADENWGRPLGTVTFGPETLHDLRSVTKSVVGLLYGIALDRKLVPALDAPLLSQFPEYAELAADKDRQKRTIEHALTMTLGMEWDETVPYTSTKNSEVAMEFAEDRFRFVLDRPLIEEPGKRWVYSGGAVALIGEIIERGTGKTLPDFAQDVLFEPLGIDKFEWNAGKDGVASPASGLRLKAADLLKIGRLVLNKGEWNGVQIVSSEWIEASISTKVPTDQGVNYGYLWWLGAAPVPTLDGTVSWAAGFGNGGQRLWVSPEADVTAVIYSGYYNNWDAWITPARVWSEILLRNLKLK